MSYDFESVVGARETSILGLKIHDIAHHGGWGRKKGDEEGRKKEGRKKERNKERKEGRLVDCRLDIVDGNKNKRVASGEII